MIKILVTALPLAAAMSVLLADTAAATQWADVLDKPLGVEVVERGTDEAPLPQITCTTYADFTLRETDTDSPAPEASAIIPAALLPKGENCAEAAGGGVRTLDTGGTRFVGRKGSLLFFEEASTNGSVPFYVLDAATGRELFNDVTADGEVISLSVEKGTLRMRFRRGVDGDCSIAQEGAACWKRIARDNDIPRAVAALPAPEKNCEQNYRSGGATGEAPSIVSFDVKLEMKGKEPATITARGPLNCMPVP